MIYALKGEAAKKGENFLVVRCGGVGFKVFTTGRVLRSVKENSEVSLFTFLYLREDQFELYGFLEEEALKLFEMLNSVSGVGPKTALGILESDSVPNIMAAIIEKRTELLTRTSGIGRKTAERIILELQSRIKLPGAKSLTKEMDLDKEVEEALFSLGYGRAEVRRAMEGAGTDEKTLEGRLRSVLRTLGRK